jgi:hypothetical protein
MGGFMRYGSREYDFAAPFADALVQDVEFRTWVLSRTKFAEHADDAKLLHDEMAAARSAATWWRSHYTEVCRCEGCRGQETDLLAIFESSEGSRFAIHIEVKQPSDRFPTKKDQAANYVKRARCWIATPPRAVLPHADADTLLLCSEKKLGEYAAHLSKFGGVITFEELRARFPHATAA